jgi:hypothetical protein
MQQQTLNKKGMESCAYLDPQMAMRIQIHLSQKNVVAYFVKVIKQLGNPINFYQVRLFWYCDSSRPIDSKTSHQLSRDWSDVISVLDE